MSNPESTENRFHQLESLYRIFHIDRKINGSYNGLNAHSEKDTSYVRS